jgi:phosphotriesterase-related protein
MSSITRRHFILSSLGLLAFKPRKPHVVTIRGEMPAAKMGTTLVHEHFLVDFIGADKISTDRWDLDTVVEKILPYLLEAKAQGVQTILDCTPEFLGRDVRLFKILSEKTGINILANTGYYGAVGYKFLPEWAFTETAEQLAARWVAEAKNGIGGTDIKPGFMKIGVNGGELSELETKLVTAAGLAHLETGLTICSHTGPALAAFGQIAVLQKMGIQPDAFVWVHAQSELKKHTYTQAAKLGAWVSLDGIGWGDFENYANWLDTLKANDCLHRVLISHDAGWYDPEKPNGENIVGYKNIFQKLIPLLERKGFKSRHLERLLVKNPAEAFAVRVRWGTD